MRIGFDAKRAFHNKTGLGNYSRSLITGLASYYPNHHYILYNTKKSNLFEYQKYPSIKEVLPKSLLYKKLHPLWRSMGIKHTFRREHLQLYHGLSNELPFGLTFKTHTLVTIHDLIFERYPKQYNAIDVLMYRKKYQYACKRADIIIAISEQTKKDIIDFYGVNSHKIVVCYQSCSPHFFMQANILQAQKIFQKYYLPKRYFLSVGAIIERKNLLTLCKAMSLLKEKCSIPLVVIGSGKGAYYDSVKKYIFEKKLEQKILFLSENAAVKNISYEEFNHDLPTIYQQSEALIYPSIFEGWGIPIIEAFFSKTPVITSPQSSMLEAGGSAALYVHPFDEQQMAEAMCQFYEDSILREQYIERGVTQANYFNQRHTTERVMNAYTILCPR
ncbi:MAG: glycosyltransferase family 4 protein [Chitinophagaceae bacterium]